MYQAQLCTQTNSPSGTNALAQDTLGCIRISILARLPDMAASHHRAAHRSRLRTWQTLTTRYGTGAFMEQAPLAARNLRDSLPLLHAATHPTFRTGQVGVSRLAHNPFESQQDVDAWVSKPSQPLPERTYPLYILSAAKNASTSTVLCTTNCGML